MCNIQDSGDTSVRMGIALLEIPMSRWMSWCNKLDGGDRHVMYWMVEIPVSGWPLVCRFIGDTRIRMVIALLEIPVSGRLSLCWRYKSQDGCYFVGDTSVRMAVTLLEIPASGWTCLSWFVFTPSWTHWLIVSDLHTLGYSLPWVLVGWINLLIPELREQGLCVLCALSPLNSVKFCLNLTYATVISTFPDLLLKYLKCLKINVL